MKCLKCGVDIYEGVKKCPYCKTPTGADSDDGKFKDFDFKYTITSAEQIKIIRDSVREAAKDNAAVSDSKGKIGRKKFNIPTIRRKKAAKKPVEQPVVRPVAEVVSDPAEKAKEMAKSASQRAAEFIPEGMARYTVRGMNGEAVSIPEPEESLNAYTRVKSEPIPERRTRSRRTRKQKKQIDMKTVIAAGVAAVCVLAVVLGIWAIGAAVAKNSDTVTPYAYIKDNGLYMIYKNKTAKLSEEVIADSYIRMAEENSSAVSAERAAKNAIVTKTTKDGKRTYFFDSFDPETGSGVLKYVDKGKAKKVKQISQAVHNSIVLSEDGRELLYLATTDKNGDMGVLYYWNDSMDEPFEIATDIDHDTFTFSGEDEWAVFLQNLNRVEMQGDLYVKSLKKLKDEKIKIDTEVCRLFGTSPKGTAYVYGKDYDTEDSSFDIYAMNKKGRSIRLGERTKKAPLMQKTKDKMFVYGLSEDGGNNLYTVEIATGKKEKIASGMNSVLMLSKDEKTVIYDKVYENRLADYYAYTKGKQPVKVAGNVVVDFNKVAGKPQMAVLEDCSKILYVSEFEPFKGGGTLTLCEYKNGKVVSETRISEDVYSVYRAADGGFIVNKDYSTSRKVFDVYLLKKGELTLLKEEISPETFGISQTGDTVYCVTNSGVEGNYGNLEAVSLKGESAEVANQVFGFNVSGDDLLLYQNLNTEDGSFDLLLKREGKKIINADTAVDEILVY